MNKKKLLARIRNSQKNVNVQNKNGLAKSYQVQQFLFLVDKYDLKMKDNYEEETENV